MICYVENMKTLDNFSKVAATDEWAIRSENWISELAKLPAKRKRRERNSTPLILCGNGVSMRIEKGALVIRDGFTHHPQTQSLHRYFRGDLALPPRILLLDGSGTLSFDVLSWLAEQNVALARISWTGDVATVASSSGTIGDREKIFWQMETGQDRAAQLAYSVDLIRTKFAHCIDTLEVAFEPSERRQRAVEKLQNAIADFSSNPPADLKQLRGIEASCASAYFGVWAGLRLNWKSTGRYPISPAWGDYEGRPSLANGLKPKNVNASHPINAMLNYAYAVKQAQLQIAAIADGYDPTIGVMHSGRRGLPAYIFDQIEPERPLVDRAILAFIRSQRFSGADFILRSDGVCRLSPQLARMIAAIVAPQSSGTPALFTTTRQSR